MSLYHLLALKPTWQMLYGLYCNHNRKIHFSHSCPLVIMWLSVRAVPECTHSGFSHEFPGWFRNSTAPPSAQMNQRTDWRDRFKLIPSTFMLSTLDCNGVGDPPRYLMLCLNKFVNIICMVQLSSSNLNGESIYPKDSPRWLLF